MVNTDRYNSEQLFGSLMIYKSLRGGWDQVVLRTVTLVFKIMFKITFKETI